MTLELQPQPIAILDSAVAERIAAGEVIDRPAAVVRELIDNALDAQATEITVELRGRGLDLIQVSDNGHGIPDDEIELAFHRHATSKLRSIDDLARLHTLGFRGEALPSIAAVAEVQLRTRVASAEAGTLISLRAGEMLHRARAARQPGTTVTVRDLFQSIPARRQFLAGGRGETKLIGHLVRRYALARPDVRFALVFDGRQSFRSSGHGRLEDVLAEVYGPAVAAALIPLVADSDDGQAIGGYLTGRTVTRPDRQHLVTIYNGRLATSRVLQAALEAAYRPLLPRGRHPIGVITIDVPPDQIDHNIHPAKSEVRLQHEAALARRLGEIVRTTLGRVPDQPGERFGYALATAQLRLPTPRRTLADSPVTNGGYASELPTVTRRLIESLAVIGQVQDSLILTEGPHGVYLFDQHRAHERVIFERLRRTTSDEAGEGQGLLEPVLLELKPHQAELLEKRLPLLETLGFDCRRIGGRSFLVRALPAVPNGTPSPAQVQALLEDAAAEEEHWQERLLASIACRSAIRRNRRLDRAAIQELLHDLAETECPAACPHGSPLILHLSPSFLQRQFGW